MLKIYISIFNFLPKSSVLQKLQITSNLSTCLPCLLVKSALQCRVNTYTAVSFISAESPEQKKCPQYGRFSVDGVSRRERHARSVQHGVQETRPVRSAEVRRKGGAGGRHRRESDSIACSLDFKTLMVGCGATDTMEFRSDCPSSDNSMVSGECRLHNYCWRFLSR